jgi:hypothetical protein
MTVGGMRRIAEAWSTSQGLIGRIRKVSKRAERLIALGLVVIGMVFGMRVRTTPWSSIACVRRSVTFHMGLSGLISHPRFLFVSRR